tara:strand:- start:310 stop:663 length:354 start_codon:yes stop_codon:yes gene_type:complete
MKIALLIIGLLLSTLTFSQNYNVGAVGFGATTAKLSGIISITDSSYTFAANEQLVTLDVKKKANTIVYVTDGVVTGSITITPYSGKVKGFKYNILIGYIMNINVPQNSVIYYCTKED